MPPVFSSVGVNVGELQQVVAHLAFVSGKYHRFSFMYCGNVSEAREAAYLLASVS